MTCGWAAQSEFRTPCEFFVASDLIRRPKRESVKTVWRPAKGSSASQTGLTTGRSASVAVIEKGMPFEEICHASSVQTSSWAPLPSVICFNPICVECGAGHVVSGEMRKECASAKL